MRGRHLDSPHIPDGLCYGPVASRRFGRSMGVSFSHAGVWACRWRCPYCQQGRFPIDATAHADPAAILRAVSQGLERHGDAIDVVCVAGGGEPSDHPAFPRLSVDLARMAHQRGKELVLLTNGDGCGDPSVKASLGRYDRIYAKWDPGVFAGAWRSADAQAVHGRFAVLAAIPGLRIQSMLFRSRGGPGNCSPVARQAWLAAMAQLRPREIHLTTVDRSPRLSTVLAVDALDLVVWRRVARRLLDVPVRVFPARAGADGA